MAMKIRKTELDGVLIIEPTVFNDQRGYFFETYQHKRYADAGISVDLVQDNLSFSKKGTLRGLHYQHPHDQAKLVRVIQGEVLDVVVNIRRGSPPTFGKWIGQYLSDENKKQIFIPEGFAHGFCVISDTAIFQYKCSDFYAPECERGVLWSDPDVGIDWPIASPIISEKDTGFTCLKDVAEDKLPSYFQN
jgi:dTDP-4-dehydrorhamnose 3,5-epimerase